MAGKISGSAKVKQVEIDVKYAGYVERAQRRAQSSSATMTALSTPPTSRRWMTSMEKRGRRPPATSCVQPPRRPRGYPHESHFKVVVYF